MKNSKNHSSTGKGNPIALRFSLSSLLAFVLAISCGLAWIVRQYQSFQRESAAATFFSTRYLAKVFAKPRKDGTYPTKPYLNPSELVANSIYSPIEHVTISDAVIDNQVVAHLRSFKTLRDLKIQHCEIAPKCDPFSWLANLERIDVRGVKLSPQHAKSIAARRSLRTLMLAGAEDCSEDCIEKMCQLQELEELAFENLQIPNGALKNIGKMKSLRSLSLHGCVFEAGILDLAELTKLESLNLSSTSIDDTTIARARCAKLESLTLDDCNVTDASLAHLTQLQNLWFLGLSNTSVTDSGIEHLQSLSKLRKLDLSGTRVTSKAATVLDQMKSLDLEQFDTGIEEIDRRSATE